MSRDISPTSFYENLARLLGAYPNIGGKMALACSGGGDSMALAYLLRGAALLAENKAAGLIQLPIPIFIVNHNMRADAADEAQQTKAFLDQFPEFTVSILTHKGAPLKSQAAARVARYDLLYKAIQAHNEGAKPPITYLLTAHNAGDQRETIAMRLARGSGFKGLGGLAPLRPMPSRFSAKDAGVQAPPLWLVRPLLGVSGDSLRGLLKAQSWPYHNDPSNQNMAFERIMWRAVLSENPAFNEQLMQFSALSRRAASWFEAAYQKAVAGHMAFYTGYGAIDLNCFHGLPPAMQLYFMQQAIAALTARDYDKSAQKLAASRDALVKGQTRLVVAGVQFICQAGKLWFAREAGKAAPLYKLKDGQVYDDLFTVTVTDQTKSKGLYVAEAGAGAKAFLADYAGRDLLPPARILQVQPALFTKGGRIIDLPCILSSGGQGVRLSART